MKLKLSIVIFLVFTVLGGKVFAAQPKSISYKGLTLTPAIKNVEISPSQPTSTFKITIVNEQEVPVVLNASSLDFKSLNESGGVAFVGNNAASVEHKHGLTNWIILPKQSLTLKPKSSKEVTVTIDNRADLTPGGHYAAILFKNVSSAGGSGNRINFNQVVATLIFVKKTGGELYDIQLTNFNQGIRWFNLPGSLPLTFMNTGNTQTSPRGIVSIKQGDKTFAKGQINSNSALVLPDSSRFYRTSLFPTAHAWLPGRYNLSITYRPDDLQVAKTVEFKFYYINLASIFGLLVIVAALVLGKRRFSKLSKRKRISTYRRHKL